MIEAPEKVSRHTHTHARTSLLDLIPDGILFFSLFSLSISLPSLLVRDTSVMICLHRQGSWLGVLLSLQVLACRFNETSGERFFPSHRQNEKLSWMLSDWWLSRKPEASNSSAVLSVTVKGATVSWRRGVIMEYKGPTTAATENSILQESLQNWPNLSPLYTHEDTETAKEKRELWFYLFLLLFTVLSLPPRLPCKTALIYMYVCSYLFEI